jgi:hypothetical protein
MRICDVCKKEMIDGFCVYDSEYYCSDDCLYSTYSPEEYNELCAEDEAYYTQWESDDVIL